VQKKLNDDANNNINNVIEELDDTIAVYLSKENQWQRCCRPSKTSDLEIDVYDRCDPLVG